jgi:hypothetical protein
MAPREKGAPSPQTFRHGHSTKERTQSPMPIILAILEAEIRRIVV